MTFQSSRIAMLTEVIRQRAHRYLPGAVVSQWRDPATLSVVISFRIPEETLFDDRSMEHTVLSMPSDAVEAIGKQSARVRAMAIGKFRLRRFRRRP